MGKFKIILILLCVYITMNFVKNLKTKKWFFYDRYGGQRKTSHDKLDLLKGLLILKKVKLILVSLCLIFSKIKNIIKGCHLSKNKKKGI